MNTNEELARMRGELDRQDEALAVLRVTVSALRAPVDARDGEVALQVDEELDERIGALLEAMTVRTTAKVPSHGIRV
jgi:hypothetical protein